MTQLRAGSSPDVGRRLRGLVVLTPGSSTCTSPHGDAEKADRTVTMEAAFPASFFDAPAAIDMVIDQGIASPDEMRAIATAWRRWGADPAATIARHWFEAIAHADTG